MKNLGMSLCASFALAACASTGWPTKANPSAMSGTPDHFLVVDATTGAKSEPAGPACRSPMTDPGDGTRLVLIRSSSGYGDYEPDKSRYGMAPDQLLRIDCSTGRAVGVTPGVPGA